MAVNYSQGFRRVDGRRENFSLDVNPKVFGFHYEKNPRLETISAQAFVEAGLAALSGQKGESYDRIVLNTAVTDHLLGLCDNPHQAVQRTKEAIDSGRAMAHLKAYIDMSKRV